MWKSLILFFSDVFSFQQNKITSSRHKPPPCTLRSLQHNKQILIQLIIAQCKLLSYTKEHYSLFVWKENCFSCFLSPAYFHCQGRTLTYNHIDVFSRHKIERGFFILNPFFSLFCSMLFAFIWKKPFSSF